MAYTLVQSRAYRENKMRMIATLEANKERLDAVTKETIESVETLGRQTAAHIVASRAAPPVVLPPRRVLPGRAIPKPVPVVEVHADTAPQAVLPPRRVMPGRMIPKPAPVVEVQVVGPVAIADRGSPKESPRDMAHMMAVFRAKHLPPRRPFVVTPPPPIIYEQHRPRGPWPPPDGIPF